MARVSLLTFGIAVNEERVSTCLINCTAAISVAAKSLGKLFAPIPNDRASPWSAQKLEKYPR